MVALSTLTQIESASQEIKKSRFLALAGPVASEEAAKDFVADHSDGSANHNCWAWRVGQAYRFNDDGEPGGTAGKPILQAIDGQSLDNVAVVVTRWFGGALLGTGGLIRAYGGTAALCLREADKLPLIPTIEAWIACGFADLALLQARLASLPTVEMLDQAFSELGATLHITVHAGHDGAVAQLVADLTNGRSQLSTEKP